MPGGFRINKAYADKYNAWRQKEELQKLKSKYGNEEDTDKLIPSESEDENAEALTEQVEKDWLRTLAAIKSKDPRIYQKDVTFYQTEGEETEDKRKKTKKDKPLYLKDYDRKVIEHILEKESDISDDDTTIDCPPIRGYDMEQEELKQSILAAVKSSDEDIPGEGDSLLKKRDKSKEEKQKEEADYLEWLKGQKDSLDSGDEVGIELEPLKNYWQRDDLDENEKFLRNYILNKQYLDKEDGGIPTYEQIVDDDDFSDEEELLAEQDTFERQYNFRFSEPGAAEIKTFPRNFEDTVRRKNTKRSEKRQEVKDRKMQVKDKKKEELKQLKKFKRQEILDKIEKLKEITGNRNLGFDEKDLDEDFDPAKHDEMMQRQFNDDYYQAGQVDAVKPSFEDMYDDEDIVDWNNWTGDGETNEDYNDEGMHELHVNDPDFCMDADYDPVAAKRKRDKKKKNKLAQALSRKKSVFDPNEKTFEEYFDEYYKLDYEDIIDGVPCRFKYRKVAPNSYGLTPDEILKCRDKELNAWASLKKMSQYRTEQEEENDLKAFIAKGRNLKKKKAVLTSLFESEIQDVDAQEQIKNDSEDIDGKKKKKKRKKGKKQRDNDAGNQDTGIPSEHSLKSSDFVEKNENPSGMCETDAQLNSRKEKKAKKLKCKHSEEGIGEMSSSLSDANIQVTTAPEASEHLNKKGKRKREESKSLEFTEIKWQKLDNELVGDISKKKERKDSAINSFIENHLVGTEGENEGAKQIDIISEGVQCSLPTSDVHLSKKKTHKKHKKHKGQKLQMSDERLKAYGINPKKYKYMKKEELFQIKPRNT